MYIDYKHKMQEEINKLGIVELLQDVETPYGVLAQGSILHDIEVKHCYYDEYTLTLKEYRKDKSKLSAVIPNFKISEWFRPVPELNDLNSQYLELYNRESAKDSKISLILIPILIVLIVLFLVAAGVPLVAWALNIIFSLGRPVDITPKFEIGIISFAVFMVLILAYFNKDFYTESKAVGNKIDNLLKSLQNGGVDCEK